MMLDAHLVAAYPPFSLDVRLRVAAGEVVALAGPSGAGKTTALRLVAGLAAPAGGYVLLDGAPLYARPPGRRSVGMVLRDPLLFSHLSVLDNVAFGPRCHGAGTAEARRAATAWLHDVGLGALARATPGELSREQAQRVALARSLAAGPRVLLLDEPLAGVADPARPELRNLLRRHLSCFAGPCVLVTHDPAEAAALADRLVVVENGAVVQDGTPEEVARHPRTRYAARLTTS
ncbi:ABC transporter ATP-binding protein [Sphaerisporangium sp. NPDC005288]|uniref:ABC transporter ATP-binding protein n=1 Tax=Sphaerisporangium sp. NPDC005288 TaxID=3155114 RepID=UPI0033B97497